MKINLIPSLRSKIHSFAALLIAFLLVSSASLAQPLKLRAVLDDPQQPGIEDGTVGIVCDNLASFSDEQKNFLDIHLLSETPGVVIETAAIENGEATAPGRSTPNKTNDDLGTLALIGNTQLRYFPPKEFLAKQTDKRRERIVVVKMTASVDSGEAVAVEPVKIRLRRPSVVLVHGINSNAGIFTQPNAIGAVLSTQGYACAYVQHGGSSGVANDRYAALRFNGNGPVEWGAYALHTTIENELQRLRRLHFAAQRVDVIAHSYGGIIARWYLRPKRNPLSTPGDSRQWYLNSQNVAGGRSLYALPPNFMNGAEFGLSEGRGVRKLITVASPLRGAPAANFVNELHGPATGAHNLASARLGLHTLAQYQRFISASAGLPAKVPSIEVLGVNSRWLQQLNAHPFRSDVAYAAIAGNDNAYLPTPLHRSDTYTALDRLLPNGWFPYLTLEERHRKQENYSDGIVPVWSAVLPGRERVVNANHSEILGNREAVAYILTALSDGALPTGDVLAPQWSTPVRLRVTRVRSNAPLIKEWKFRPGEMAPRIQNDIYREVGGVARINPDAIREIDSPRQVFVTARQTHIAWRTATDTTGEVLIYQSERVAGTPYRTYKLVQRKTEPGAARKEHRVDIDVSALDAGLEYVYVAESRVLDPPDNDIRLKSPRRRLLVYR